MLFLVWASRRLVTHFQVDVVGVGASLAASLAALQRRRDPYCIYLQMDYQPPGRTHQNQQDKTPPRWLLDLELGRFGTSAEMGKVRADAI